MKEKIKVAEIANELRVSYLDYALSVIISRALPDVRDGLKPVQRRILYVMRELGLWPNSKFTKSANIVGNTIARYHPHGDQAVYESLVRLAQDFSMRYPLVIGQGNFGSIDGDAPAAYRYTEAKLSPLAVEMLADIEKNSVDFRANYDNTREEPVVLPSKIPQLLLNGSLGIAVGMATNIPPHNLKEVVNAVKKLIENPDLSIEELLEIIKGPDFPTGAIVYGYKSLLEAYRSGKGAITIRSKLAIEETKRGNKRIVVTEIPWQTNKSELIRQIAELSLNKVLPEIKEVRDESNKEGIRIVIEISEKDENIIQKIIEKLFNLTDLQKNYYFNFVALDEGIQPRLFNIKELFIKWIEYRKKVIIRRTKFDLERTKERIEILEGLRKALANIDLVIKIIKKSIDKETAKKNLLQKLKLTERQAEAILEMPLRNLTSLEIKKILEELEEKIKLKEELEKILKSSKKVNEIIIKELEEIEKKYGDERKTVIVKEDLEIEKKKEEIPEEDVLLLINSKKYVRAYKIDTPWEKIIKEKENFGKIILAKTTERLIAYSQKGKIYTLSVYDFYKTPQYLETNLRVEKNDSLLEAIKYNFQQPLLIFTKNGLGKKISPEDAFSNRKSGTLVIKLSNNDEVIKVLEDNNANIFLITTDGYGLGIKSDLPLQSKSAKGVKVIKLKNSYLVNALPLTKNYLLLVFSNGYFKKISLKEINIQKRGGRGVKLFDLNEKIGSLIFTGVINDDDKLAVINDKIEIIQGPDIPLVKRINRPVKKIDKVREVVII